MSNSIIGPILSSMSGIFIDKGISVVTDLVKDVTDDGAAAIKNFIEDKTGVDLSNEDQVTELTAEQANQINSVVSKYDVELEAIRNKNLSLIVEDVQDARETHVEMAKMGFYGIVNFQNILAFMQTTAVMVLCVSLVMVEVPEANQRYIDSILMFALGATVATINGYYYGNSNKQ